MSEVKLSAERLAELEGDAVVFAAAPKFLQDVYVITRGFKEGKALTSAQRISPLFAEEPVVLGKVLRRGSQPMRLTQVEYKAGEARLLALEKAGAINIKRPENNMKPCEKCGQVPCGQGGDFKCPACGLPLVFDPEALPTAAVPVVPVTPPSEPVANVPPELPPAPVEEKKPEEEKEEPKTEISESLETSKSSGKKKKA